MWYNGNSGRLRTLATSLINFNTSLTQYAFCSFNFILNPKTLDAEISLSFVLVDVERILVAHFHFQFFSQLGGNNQAAT
jgi:hypothetical protein